MKVPEAITDPDLAKKHFDPETYWDAATVSMDVKVPDGVKWRRIKIAIDGMLLRKALDGDEWSKTSIATLLWNQFEALALSSSRPKSIDPTPTPSNGAPIHKGEIKG